MMRRPPRMTKDAVKQLLFGMGDVMCCLASLVINLDTVWNGNYTGRDEIRAWDTPLSERGWFFELWEHVKIDHVEELPLPSVHLDSSDY